ncbi:MAG TPA: carboxypeptidase-like regulatory domain-containing protein [Solirubrobacterales bacterium]|nr:carboxypeptidase-like regulatory domain-containing protein [Solirubrobacterales bacterium]
MRTTARGGSATIRRRLVGCGAGLLAVLGLAIASVSAAQASPARYVLEKCDSALPGGGTAGAIFNGAPGYTGGNNCAEPSGVVGMLQEAATTTSSVSWSVPLPPPPGGSVESVTVTAQVCNGTNHDPGTVAWAVQAGWPLTCTPETRTFAVNSTTGSQGLLYLGCQGSCEADPFAWAHYFAATEVDPIPPVVRNLEGPALAAGPLRGHQALSATATDEGGGVSNLVVTVNGQPAAAAVTPVCQTARVANASVVGTVAITPTPCPSELHADWTLNTASPPFGEGANTVQVCARDFATLDQPNEGCSTPVSVDVDNSCAESPVVGGALLAARFTRSARAAVTLPYGKGAKLDGDLTDQSGNPIAGATICIEAQGAGTSGTSRPLATATTDPTGHFAAEVGPGPNQKILVGYRHDSFQISQTLSMRTHARPTLRARPRRLRNGERVVLRGKLPEPAAADRVVVLQAGVPGSHRWITFRKATTGPRGSFKASYHFTSTTRKITYRFRAFVPHQSGYPWAQGASRPAKVTVIR